MPRARCPSGTRRDAGSRSVVRSECGYSRPRSPQAPQAFASKEPHVTQPFSSSISLNRRQALGLAAGLGTLAVAGRAAVSPASAQGMQMQTAMIDAYSFLLSDERFTTWVRLIAAGGLESYARAPTPYTVFPVTDAGFAKFPEVVNELLGYQNRTNDRGGAPYPDTSKIVKLVRSHVIAGKHLPSEGGGKMVSKTVAGTDLTVDLTAKPPSIAWRSVVNGKILTANVTDNPVQTLNAIIYPVDAIYSEGF